MNGLSDPALAAATCDDGAPPARGGFEEIAVVEHGAYRVLLYSGETEGDVVEVWGGGRLLDRIEDIRLSLGIPTSSGGSPSLLGVSRFSPPDGGRTISTLFDLTGGGEPNLVVTGWSGGAHCCETVHVLELGDTYRVVFREALGDGGASLEQLDGRPGLEMRVSDALFVDWRTTFAHSRLPEVILRYDGARYEPEPDLMRRPAPDAESLHAEAAAVRQSNAWEEWRAQGVTPEVTNTMLRLIYTGHYGEAQRFMDEAWPAGRPGKELFWSQFRCRLQSGRYWQGIAALNGFDDPLLVPAGCDDGGNQFF